MPTQQHIFNVRLSEPEREILTRLARENDRSRASQIRQLIRSAGQTDQRQSGAVPNYGPLT